MAIVRLRVGLGDLLCSLPAWRAVRRFRPDLRLTMISWPEMAPLLARMSQYVDELLPFPGYPGIPERPPDHAAWPRFLDAARACQFDLAIQAYGDRPAANEITELLGARRVGGFCAQGWVPASDPDLYVPYPHDVHEVERHLRLVTHLGVPPDTDAEALEFPIIDQDRVQFDRATGSAGLRTSRYAVLHPGASAPSRRWPAQRYGQLADHLAARGLRVVLGGTADEQPVAEAVRHHMRGDAVNLAGRTSLGAYALVLRHAALLVCNDTGPAHLAAAVRTPTVVIFLSGDPVRWAHRLPHHRAALVSVGCNPCGLLDCPIDFRCATRLPVSLVLDQIDELLR